jgi:hypothetical protein
MDVQRVVSYRHFCNKVWNAVRYALPLLETTDGEDAATPADLSLLRGDMTLADRWIMSRLVSASLAAMIPPRKRELILALRDDAGCCRVRGERRDRR